MSHIAARLGDVVRADNGGPRMLVVDYVEPAPGEFRRLLVCAFEADGLPCRVAEGIWPPSKLTLVARPPCRDWDLFA